MQSHATANKTSKPRGLFLYTPLYVPRSITKTILKARLINLLSLIVFAILYAVVKAVMGEDRMNIRARWCGKTIAESDRTIEIEGNHYFPPDTVNQDFLRASNQTTFCGWKGDANYQDIVVDGEVNESAAWFYADPLEAAHNIKDYVAFWKGVEIVETPAL